MARSLLYITVCALLLPSVAPFLSPIFGRKQHHTVPDPKCTLSSFHHAPTRPHSIPGFFAPGIVCRKKSSSRRLLCLASSQAATFEEAPQWQSLVQYIRSSGGWVSDSIAAGSYHGGERGLFATSQTSGAVAFIPADCFLSVVSDGAEAHAPESRILGDIFRDTKLDMRLAIRLLMELRGEGSSAFAPYLQSLPSPVSMHACMHTHA
jgi:hypothetical protein